MCADAASLQSMIHGRGAEDPRSGAAAGAGSSSTVVWSEDGGQETKKLKLQQEGLGVAATILAIPPAGYSGEADEKASAREQQLDPAVGDSAPELPQSVLQIVATSLQCDVLVAALVRQPFNLAETVLCVPQGLVTVPVRLTPGLLKAAAGGLPVSTEGVRLPSLLGTVLGERPKRLLATQFQAEGHDGICYALWLDPNRVPPDCQHVMVEAGKSLPLLLAAKVRTSCWDRVGRRFDVILKAMPQAVVFVDDGTGPCVVNSAASHLLALDGAGEVDAKVLGVGMCRLANRCVLRANAYRCFKEVAANRHQLFQWDWELKDPRRVYRVRSYPVSKSATHGRIWFFNDITAEWDAQLAVEAADKAKTQFLAMMSHELRTPMTGVLGMLELLRHDKSLSGEQAKYVRAMQGCGQGLMQVLDEILDFSAIQAGKFTLEVKDFHIGELMEHVSALFQGYLEEKKLYLTMILPDMRQQAVRGDERIRQVVTNLISNAIKFTETGGIDVSWLPVKVPGNEGMSLSMLSGQAKEEEEEEEERHSTTAASSTIYRKRPPALKNVKVTEVATSTIGCTSSRISSSMTTVWHEVRVKDSGIGLSKEQQGRLFQSFSQADTSTTRKFGGTGLGLAISKGLVTAMGGQIWVESEPGKGSTFAFRIPLLPALGLAKTTCRETLEPKADSLKKMIRCLRVLAADDDRVSRALLEKMLQRYGHEVQLVGNGQLAVEAMKKAHYDIVLMDLQMPVLDGLSATKQIRSLDGPASKVPIYALTADVLTKEQETLEDMKLDGYLTKPINWESLSKVIGTVVASTSAPSLTVGSIVSDLSSSIQVPSLPRELFHPDAEKPPISKEAQWSYLRQDESVERYILFQHIYKGA